jgi:hypothetical protein
MPDFAGPPLLAINDQPHPHVVDSQGEMAILVTLLGAAPQVAWVDCEIDHCRIHQSFDSAVSPQPHGALAHCERMNVHHNKIAACGLFGIEFTIFCYNARNTGITVADNEVVDTGYGWSGDRGGHGIDFGVNAQATESTRKSQKSEAPEQTLCQGTIRKWATALRT